MFDAIRPEPRPQRLAQETTGGPRAAVYKASPGADVARPVSSASVPGRLRTRLSAPQIDTHSPLSLPPAYLLAWPGGAEGDERRGAAAARGRHQGTKRLAGLGRPQARYPVAVAAAAVGEEGGGEMRGTCEAPGPVPVHAHMSVQVAARAEAAPRGRCGRGASPQRYTPQRAQAASLAPSLWVVAGSSVLGCSAAGSSAAGRYSGHPTPAAEAEDNDAAAAAAAGEAGAAAGAEGAPPADPFEAAAAAAAVAAAAAAAASTCSAVTPETPPPQLWKPRQSTLPSAGLW